MCSQPTVGARGLRERLRSQSSLNDQLQAVLRSEFRLRQTVAVRGGHDFQKRFFAEKQLRRLCARACHDCAARHRSCLRKNLGNYCSSRLEGRVRRLLTSFNPRPLMHLFDETERGPIRPAVDRQQIAHFVLVDLDHRHGGRGTRRTDSRPLQENPAHRR